MNAVLHQQKCAEYVHGLPGRIAHKCARLRPDAGGQQETRCWRILLITLHVIIIPGVGQILKLSFGTPRVSQNWDWAILTHGNGRYGYYKNLVFLSEIEKCQHFFQQPDLGFRWESTPRVNRPNKTNPPPGADFTISPSGFNYDMQSFTLLLNFTLRV